MLFSKILDKRCKNTELLVFQDSLLTVVATDAWTYMRVRRFWHFFTNFWSPEPVMLSQKAWILFSPFCLGMSRISLLIESIRSVRLISHPQTSCGSQNSTSVAT